jgi:CDP-glucose 4,6-dehydratase
LELGQGAVEDLVSLNGSVWKDRSVLLTGHTGFKGGWLSLWLRELGAAVHGYSLEPPTDPSLFNAAQIGGVLASDIRADLSDFAAVSEAVRAAQPSVVFHLAAQPLVRESYRDPLRTLRANVIGTAHVLEAARLASSVKAVIVVTTDKVYENRESHHAYRESDPLGGRDPYSASKAATELVTASYRASFFQAAGAAAVASARAGNVIGGGDWAADRLVPDCLRAFAKEQPVRLRFPHSVRPWQHVLEPLSGYLLLAERLVGPDGARFARSWNFGPSPNEEATVGEIAEMAARFWGKGAEIIVAGSTADPKEAALLKLDSTNARQELKWRPRWSVERALRETIDWHRHWLDGADMTEFTLEQIRRYWKRQGE